MPTPPLMPTGADQVQSPMAMPPMSPGGPTGPGPGGDLASLLGVGGAPMGGVDPIQGVLNQFDQLAQLVNNLSLMLPGTEQMASQMMAILQQWMQQAVVMNTPQTSSMPGAQNMM